MSDTDVTIFAPTTTLSVTVECTNEVEELHIHPAGQGYWVARMLATLGARPVLCTPVGGETGNVLRTLLSELPSEGLVECGTANGGYVHDRRSGDREVVADVASAPLDRHTLDDLVSTTLGAGLRCGTVVVCGSNLHGNIAPEVFTRVCADLRAGGAQVVADLSGAELLAALEGGVDLLKLSHEEMIRDGWSDGDDTDSLIAGIGLLAGSGAVDVVVSRSDAGSLAYVGGRLYELTSPKMLVVDPRGAGDSMTAALAHGLASRRSWPEALRLAAGAAALNVTRHGLASGHLDAITQLAAQVELTALDRQVDVRRRSSAT